MITVSGNGTFEEKQRCCGCGACEAVCPAGCLSLEADAEGFLYPHIDRDSCIGCGLCEKVCPVRAAGGKEENAARGKEGAAGGKEETVPGKEEVPFPQEGYIAQIRDEEIRRQSTSGGAFTAIARQVLRQGGVVFGAAYTEDFRVRHIGVEREEELRRFRNSKYVQSETAQAFREAGEYLRAGRPVCFGGTPCQIEGLLNYLERKYGGRKAQVQDAPEQALQASAAMEQPDTMEHAPGEPADRDLREQALQARETEQAPAGKPEDRAPGMQILDGLITVDVVCHAVPSPLVFAKYVRMQQGRFGRRLGDILFREKHFGYKYSTMTLRDREGKDLYVHGIDTDPMLRAFFADVCDRPSCYDCRFKKRYRRSDFTLWDCYTVYQFDADMDDDRGTTRVLIHSEKGRRLFAQIRKDLRCTAVDPDALTDGVREMFRSVDLSKDREAFMRDAAVLTGRDLFRKWFPETWKVRAERTARKVLVRTGLYSGAKKWLFYLRGGGFSRGSRSGRNRNRLH